jgi:hypothetical protein
VGAALLSFTLNHTLSPSAEGSFLIEDTGQGLAAGMAASAVAASAIIVLALRYQRRAEASTATSA